ncbi:MAG: glucosamine inositolphosphorylceramide transferase family protein [Chloroflexota bacterium]
MTRKPRLGLILDSTSVPAWTYRLVERLLAADLAEVALLVHSGLEPAAPALLESYLRLERRFLRGIPDPLARRNLRALLPVTPLIDADDRQTIQSQRLDILLNLSNNDFSRSSLRACARLGLWTWDAHPASGFREVLENQPLTTCELRACLPDSDSPGVIRRAVFATDPISASRNRNHVFIKTASLLLWALKRLELSSDERFLDGLEAVVETKSIAPGFFDLVKLAFAQATRYLGKKVRSRLDREQWIVLAAQSQGGLAPDWGALRPLVPPRDRYWADPMPVERNGQTCMFIEEFMKDTRRGRIACLTLDAQGQVVSNQTILERPYHLSYPFIFEFNAETYMIPETAQNRQIELYRCIRFPDEWEFVRPLMIDVYAVDSTLLEHDGRWWLFANLKTEDGASSWDELHLFWADSPLSEAWTPHPLNPVISDVRIARPAGPIFEHEGRLHRPSQDCSRGYGFAININRIEVLTETEYRETLIEKILPQGNLRATHTLSRTGDWIAVDAVRPLK